MLLNTYTPELLSAISLILCGVASSMISISLYHSICRRWYVSNYLPELKIRTDISIKTLSTLTCLFLIISIPQIILMASFASQRDILVQGLITTLLGMWYSLLVVPNALFRSLLNTVVILLLTLPFLILIAVDPNSDINRAIWLHYSTILIAILLGLIFDIYKNLYSRV